MLPNAPDAIKIALILSGLVFKKRYINRMKAVTAADNATKKGWVPLRIPKIEPVFATLVMPKKLVTITWLPAGRRLCTAALLSWSAKMSAATPAIK